MQLQDTVELMRSSDYHDRFKAEYNQVKIRYDRLLTMLEKWDNDILEYTPNCPREVYNFQVRAMKEYIDILVIRAKIENIEL